MGDQAVQSRDVIALWARSRTGRRSEDRGGRDRGPYREYWHAPADFDSTKVETLPKGGHDPADDSFRGLSSGWDISRAPPRVGRWVLYPGDLTRPRKSRAAQRGMGGCRTPRAKPTGVTAPEDTQDIRDALNSLLLEMRLLPSPFDAS